MLDVLKFIFIKLLQYSSVAEQVASERIASKLYISSIVASTIIKRMDLTIPNGLSFGLHRFG